LKKHFILLGNQDDPAKVSGGEVGLDVGFEAGG